MKKKSITENYIFNLIYQATIILIPLITIPYLTRVLGTENLGIYSYTYSIVTIFYLFAALGTNTYGQREIAYVQEKIDKRSKVFWEIVIIRFFSTFVSLLCLFIFSQITARYSIYYILFMVYVAANMLDITWFFQGLENFKGVAIRNCIVKILYLICVFLFIKKPQDLYIYIIIFSLSTFITNASFWFKIKEYVNRVSIKNLELKKHLKLVIVFFIPQIATLIYTVLDKTMIGIIVPKIDNVYFYEQATYIDKTVLMLITTMGTVMASRVSYVFKHEGLEKVKEYTKTIICFVWLLGSLLLFGICGVIKNFVPIFYGPGCNDIIYLVYLMSPLIIIIGLNNVIGIQYLIPTNQQNKYVKAVLIGAVINFILNIILINLIGSIGAAISSVIAELFILLIELYYVKKAISFKDVFMKNLKYVLVGIITFLTTYYSGSLFKTSILGIIIQSLIGLTTYTIILVLTKDNFLNDYVFGFFRYKKEAQK